MEGMKMSNDGFDGRIAHNRWMMKMIVIFFFSHILQDEISSRESKKKKTLKKKAKIYFWSLHFGPNFILVTKLILRDMANRVHYWHTKYWCK